MKKLLLPLCLLTLAATAQKKPVAKPAPVPAYKPKNLIDSASYAIGLSVANFYAQQGIKNLNGATVARAIADAQTNKKTALNEMQVNEVIMRCMNMVQQSKAAPNIQAGEKFLAQNKARPGIKTTASGLQYEVLTQGSGAKPEATDSVTVNYLGKLLDGTEFDNSYKRGQPITFQLSGVIRGWTEALQLMPVGSKYRLFIPQQLGYGTQEMGSIPAGSVLIFEVELLDIPNKK